jgi:hypothetical protein
MAVLSIHHEAFDEHYMSLMELASNELILQSDHDSMEPEVQELYDFYPHFVKPVLKHSHDMYVVLCTPDVPQVGDYKIEFNDKRFVVSMIFTAKHNTVQRLVRFNHETVPLVHFSPCSDYQRMTRDEREFWASS